MRLKIAFISILGLSSTYCIDPFNRGQYEVDHVSINPEVFGELDHHLEVFAPRAEGKFPTIVFFSGLAVTTNAGVYSTVLSHISSWGYVVIGPWSALSIPTTTYEAKWVEPVLDWARTHLDPRSETNYGIHPGVVIDFDTMFMAGQSSGNHVAVNYLALRQNNDCSKIHGLIMMSPVDGVDPYGIIGDTCIDPPNKLNFQIPSLIISGGLDSVPGVDGLGNLFPACAPEDLSNDRFYDALTGPTILVNTTEYGHIDCFDDALYNLVAGLHLCATNRNMDRDIYRRYLGGEIVAFLKYFHEGDCEMLPFLREINFENIAGYVDTKGSVETSCNQDSCLWSDNPLNYIKL